MEPEFWHERWDSGDPLAFNQAEPNRLLTAHWSQLGVAPSSAVFVPLCGKSVDMVWLASQGHAVVGNELSERAVVDFFDERDLAAETPASGALTVHSAGPYELWAGDLFEMTADAVARCNAVYDRASIVALPPDLRRRYAEHLIEILPADVPIFMLAFEYDQSEMDGPPFSVTGDEIAKLFGGVYDIERVVGESGDPGEVMRTRGLSQITETLTILRPR